MAVIRICQNFVAIVRMNLVNPESGLQPLFQLITQQALGAFADVGDVEGFGVRFPDDTFDGVDDIVESFLGLLLLGNIGDDCTETVDVAVGVKKGKLDR